MALPYLIKHIYNFGTEEVIRRGKKIHALGNVELIEYDDLMGNIIFRVKDDGYSTFYKVHINQFKDPKTISLRCSFHASSIMAKARLRSTPRISSFPSLS